MTEREAYAALARLGFRKKVWETLAETGSARATWALLGRPGLEPAACLRELEALPDRFITPADPEYRTGLGHLKEPPLVLFLRGQALPSGLSVAVVGSRQATPYGLSVAERLGRDLAQAGVTVVSGLARGIDAAAHLGALRHPGAAPVAVLGCGLDHDYPVENRLLKRRLERSGTLVSEYRPHDPPEPWRFPQRNRILAGLSTAVLVVEAGERSGAMITVDHAMELGREILVVPGDVGQPNSRGTLKLLREGATPVGTAEHVLEALGLDPVAYAPEPLDAALQSVLVCLAPRGSLPDEVMERTQLSIAQTLAALGQLQMLGKVRRVGPAFVPL